MEDFRLFKLYLFHVGTNASSFLNNEEESPENYGILDKLYCKLCEEAMKLVEREIGRDSSKVSHIVLNNLMKKKTVPMQFSQAEIKNALDRACTIIPEKRLRGKCRNAIKEKGDKIADQIVGNISTEVICKYINFC